jgi:predicted branched-subunit amino acid permease
VSEVRPEVQGARDAIPVGIGVIPFGIVAGASAVDKGFGISGAVGFSTIVFAGASQLAAMDLLSSGSAVAVAVATAWLINLRMVMYSAALAPWLGHESLGRRSLAAYVLTDQAFALSITRYSAGYPPEARLRYYLGVGLSMWVNWVVMTVIGALIGPAIPEDVPLDFAIPLCFLVLIVPAVKDVPTAVAGVVGGVGAVLVAEAGLQDAAIVLGAVLGIAAGTVADWRISPEDP